MFYTVTYDKNKSFLIFSFSMFLLELFQKDFKNKETTIDQYVEEVFLGKLNTLFKSER